MTQEQIEGNKLIAESPFGNLVRGSSKEERWYRKDTGQQGYYTELKYHSSWDWLMPALLKAKGTKGSDEWNGWNTLNISLMACDIKGVFLQLTWFIKWFNTQSK